MTILDTATIDYFERRLPLIATPNIPQDSAGVINYLATNTPTTIPISQWVNDAAEQKSYWKDELPTFTIVEHENPCVFLERTLYRIMDFPGLANIDNFTENSMPMFTDNFLFLWLVIFRSRLSHNSSTTVTGSKRPDFSAAPFGAPIIVGEDKLRDNYTPGSYGKDPILENEEKMAFDLWTEFYGEIPFIFSYAAIADSIRYEFTLGLLVRNSKRFEAIKTYDLSLIQDRINLTKDILTLAPIFRAIGLQQKTTKKNIHFHMHKDGAPGNVSGALSWTIDIAVDHNVPVVSKKWVFVAEGKANAFMDRMRSIFAELLSVENHHHKFIYLHNNMIQIKNNNNEVLAQFRPFGFHFHPANVDELLHALVEVTFIIEDLQNVRIIHQDIRWDNLIVVRDGNCSYIVLIDFDDAVLLAQNEEVTEGCAWMDPHSHAPNIRNLHSFEVDVWSIYRLILDKTTTVQDHEKINLLNLLATSIHSTYIDAQNRHELGENFARNEILRIRNVLIDIQNHA